MTSDHSSDRQSKHSLSETQTYLEQHHGGDGSTAAQRTIDNYQRHHNEDFWAFWQRHSCTLPDNAQVVDLGTGAGQFLRDIAIQNPDWSCTGIECAPYMLNKQFSLPDNATVLIDDLNSPAGNLFKSSIDLAMANMLIHELHQPVGLFKTLRHWLKPGGTLILIDMVRQPLQSYMPHSYPDLIERDRNELEHAFNQYQEHNRYSADDLIWMLELCGFTIVERENIRSSRAVRLVASS